MEYLKEVFGSEALTFEQLKEKLKDNKGVKLANLADGNYVDKAKLDGKVQELEKANQTIKDLQETVKKFDGVDVEGLRKSVKDWESKYNADIADLRKQNAVDMAIIAAKGKNTRAIKALLDLEKVTVKADGSLEGLDLEGLKKSDPYLFTMEETKPAGNGGGAGGGTGGNENKTVLEQFENAVFRK